MYFRNRIPNIPELEARNFKATVIKAPLGVTSHTLFQHILLPKAANIDKVAVLFCPYYTSPLFCYRGAIVITLHDISYEVFSSGPSSSGLRQRLYLRKNSRWSASRASAIIVPSDFTKSEVVSYYGVNAEKVFVIRDGVEEKFRPLNDLRAVRHIRRKYKLGDNFILFLGIIFGRRHIPELIEAYKLAFPKLRGHEFVIIGKNQTDPYIDIDALIAKYVSCWNLPIRRIEFLPEEDIVPMYNAASLFVYLSDYEGFGLPVLEAMACGRPVITAHKTSLIEVAGDAAFMVRDPRSVSEIAAALRRLVSDATLRKRLATKGLDRARKFSWDSCASRTLEVIKGNVDGDAESARSD